MKGCTVLGWWAARFICLQRLLRSERLILQLCLEVTQVFVATCSGVASFWPVYRTAAMELVVHLFLCVLTSGQSARKISVSALACWQPNRAPLWGPTHEPVLPSPARGFCFSSSPFSDRLQSLFCIHLAVSKYCMGIWGWGLTCPIQQDIALTSSCLLAAAVPPAECCCLHTCTSKGRLSSKRGRAGAFGEMLRLCFDPCHGPGGQILSALSACLPFFT